MYYKTVSNGASVTLSRLCDDSSSNRRLLYFFLTLSQLSEVLVEMGSNLMQVENQILALAQREKRACSSIVYSLETLAWPQLHSHAQDFSMVGTINLLLLP